jgi:prepilin-type N-terminal cleavage/methylation domain-containing protein
MRRPRDRRDRSPGRPVERADDGFTLIEVLVATTVFAILATAFAFTISGALRSFQASKIRTVAEQTASSALEDARRLSYDDLGTVGGNPPGVLAASRTVTNGGQTLNVATRVSYVNDQVPTSPETGADYKQIRVIVTSSTLPTLNVQMVTTMAPDEQPSINEGLVKMQVVDYALNQPVVGALVSLGAGPSAPRADTTDATGKVSFAALDPTTSSGSTSKYTIGVSAAGYQALPEDQAPNSAASTSLAAGQIFNTVIRVFKPVTLNVHLVTTTGAPFTGAASIAVSSSRGSGSVPTSTSDTALTSVASSPLVPSVQYTVGASATGYYAASQTTQVPISNYPTVLAADVTLTMKAASTGTIQATLKDSTGAVVSGATVLLTGGPGGIVLTATTNTSGVATFTVPLGSSPVYVLSTRATSSYGASSTNVTGPTNSTPVTVNLTVPKL